MSVDESWQGVECFQDGDLYIGLGGRFSCGIPHGK